MFATADSKSRVPLRPEATNVLGVDVLGTPHEGENRVTYPVPMYRGRVHLDPAPLSPRVPEAFAAVEMAPGCRAELPPIVTYKGSEMAQDLNSGYWNHFFNEWPARVAV